ncbi:unnamed protein product [Chrysodeixis includens]|uniref:Uncharacterized protein n=1 Tax=Chrysodeixis includens TaxID=689277 RepID=A0A9N8KWW9_CHRIL|nr:unnamed protein product [Chrysodeixis includens]
MVTLIPSVLKTLQKRGRIGCFLNTTNHLTAGERRRGRCRSLPAKPVYKNTTYLLHIDIDNFIPSSPGGGDSAALARYRDRGCEGWATRALRAIDTRAQWNAWG